ncbi:MAG: hypothetical protein LIP01_13195 [Tannerellaceae bacterium]|nr:hypothetical protein [Tannerellaceae bacterium]
MEELYEQTRLLKDCFLELVECVAYRVRERPEEESGENCRKLEEILMELAAGLLKLEKCLQKDREDREKEIPDNTPECQVKQAVLLDSAEDNL